MKKELTALLLDDESKSREVLRTLLGIYCPQVDIIAETSNINDAAMILNQRKIDIVFLDIEMPGGNGFQLLEKFNTPDFNVVFVTSFDHYAIKAIKYSALDYILKPVIVAELIDAVEKAFLNKKNSYNSSEEISLLKQNLKTAPKDSKLFINNKTKLEYVVMNEIICLSADSNYTHIYCNNDKMYNAPKTLKEYEEILCNEELGFIRIHKSSIINPNYIKKVTMDESVEIVMKNNIVFQVSRRKRNEILQLLSNKLKY